MVDKFNNIFFLIVYFAHFIIVGSYAFQLVFDTKKFLKGRGVDKTATLITRFAGSFMVGIVLMAIYIAFVRSGGLEATWAFFNLVFIFLILSFLYKRNLILYRPIGVILSPSIFFMPIPLLPKAHFTLYLSKVR